MNKIVSFTENGITKAAVVSEDTKEKDYSKGLILGPPESFSSLKITTQQREVLSKMLFEAGIHTALDMMGKRKEVMDMFVKLQLNKKLHKPLLRQLIGLYQAEYFGE